MQMMSLPADRRSRKGEYPDKNRAAFPTDGHSEDEKRPENPVQAAVPVCCKARSGHLQG